MAGPSSLKPYGSSLPPDLLPLVPLLERWDVGDDVVRWGQIQAASSEELRALVRTVWPLFDAINRYLDEPRETETVDEAPLLWLSEAAAEARIELEARGADGDLPPYSTVSGVSPK